MIEVDPDFPDVALIDQRFRFRWHVELKGGKYRIEFLV